ncbi:MAG TPA: glutamate--cysteine ligase [Ilumatobacteraceae bacterium]|nr:glutamate--cysteine ligase [Ilumatobacteraceae bacterium]
MTITFRHNPRPTVGVEMELHVVDRTTGALVAAANQLLDELGEPHPGGEHPKAKHELFQSTVEIITGVCDTPAQAGDDLRATLAELRRAADRRDLTFMSAGTHPFALAREQLVSPNPRYAELIETMQWPARRLLICGLHVHVGVRDGERAITIINELRRHLPLFLALSSSSPYFEGDDSGLASARSKVFESLPTAGLPPRLDDWTDFEAFMSTLLESNCISSIREVWWDIRPHPDFGTIEFRMCDATSTVRETVALAALAQTLVAWCDRQIDEGSLPIPPREWTVRENRWLAARYGIDAELIVEHAETGHPERRPVRDLVGELLDALQPTAEGLGTAEQLGDVRSILSTGTSAMRQRAIVERGGTLLDVVQHLVESLATDGLPDIDTIA